MLGELAMLRLQVEWGADEAIGADPVDRTSAPARQPSQSPRPLSHESAPVGVPATVAATTLDELAAALDSSDGHGLRATATRTVRWSGNPASTVMLIAEAPGADDDRSGIAFSGSAGQVLDRVLGSAGLTRDTMLRTYLVPWRPPGGRTPTSREVAAALPYVHALLALIRPRWTLLLGATAVKALTGRAETIRKLRGTWLEVKVTAFSLSSSALPLPPIEQWLESPQAKERLWRDLTSLHKTITTL